MRIFLLLFGKNHKEIIYYYTVFAISGEIRGEDIGSMPIVPKTTVGKVGSSQYYCWECFVEFLIQKDKIVIYEVCDDGTLLPYGKENNQLTIGG